LFGVFRKRFSCAASFILIQNNNNERSLVLGKKLFIVLYYKYITTWKPNFKQSKINFSKEVNNYYPEILTDEALNFTALHLIKKDYRY
jgi:hypothetical protein